MSEADRPVTITLPTEHAILTGIDLGRSTREQLDLDAMDGSDRTAVLRIDTPVVTSTFIKGLIEPSVQALGYDGFTQKYRLDASPNVRANILATARVAELDKSGM